MENILTLLNVCVFSDMVNIRPHFKRIWLHQNSERWDAAKTSVPVTLVCDFQFVTPIQHIAHTFLGLASFNRFRGKKILESFYAICLTFVFTSICPPPWDTMGEKPHSVSEVQINWSFRRQGPHYKTNNSVLLDGIKLLGT